MTEKHALGKLPLPPPPCPYHAQLLSTVNDIYGTVGAAAADAQAANRRSRRNGYGQWAIGVLLGVIGIAVPAIVSVQVARIGQIKPAQIDLDAEQQHQRDLEAITVKLDAKLDGLRADLEQQRRGYPQPLHQSEPK
jgi:hypothetical protein